MAKGDDIQERLIQFAVLIINLSKKLPSTGIGRHLQDQLFRSGTSPAPNYGEARGAESRKDFIHKLGVVLKELHETAVWLEIARRAQLLPDDVVLNAIDECQQLCRVIGSSIATTKSNS